MQAYADSSSDAREKMFERDKTSLREMGVALEVVEIEAFEDVAAHRYLIAKGSFDWPKDLKISSEQFQLLELAARAWNNRLMAPSAQSGLTRLKALGVMPNNRELSIFTPRLIAKHQSFEPLTIAISEQQRAKFSYRKPDDEPSNRELSPQKLRFIEGQWVLLALENGQLKNFLLRRIVSEVTLLPDASEQASPESIALAEAELIEFINSQQATLELTQDSEAWWHFGAPESNQVTLNFMDEALLAEDLIEFGGELKVLDPESLAKRISLGLAKVVSDHA
ncbi:MAG: WYL domain-containing protein [Aquiluna sp.]|nr:WYL domain-containing protein [Aquiluna sp.]